MIDELQNCAFGSPKLSDKRSILQQTVALRHGHVGFCWKQRKNNGRSREWAIASVGVAGSYCSDPSATLLVRRRSCDCAGDVMKSVPTDLSEQLNRQRRKVDFDTFDI